MDVSFVNSFVLSCPCWVQCLPVFFSPFRSFYSWLRKVSIFLLALATLGITLFFFCFLLSAQFLPTVLYFTAAVTVLFSSVVKMLIYGLEVHGIYVHDMSCDIFSLPRFLHGCFVFLSAQPFSIFSDLAHSAFYLQPSELR